MLAFQPCRSKVIRDLPGGWWHWVKTSMCPFCKAASMRLWTSYSDNDIVGGMVFLEKKTGGTPQRSGRSRRHGQVWRYRGPPLCAARGPYTFLRNEPNLLSGIFQCITLIFRGLCRLQKRLQVGSFSKTNPPGRDFGGVLAGWRRLLPAKEERRAGRSPYNSGGAERRAQRSRPTNGR
jgi:hypothetical protein